jgi:hypothetical protein
MAVVSGVVHTETGAPALGATVRAFDKDLRHEQLLGEAVITETTGRYEITYTADQFRRAEKKTADLIVRAFDQEGNLRAESEIRFNASDNERIDLTFGPLPVIETPRLSELEQLQNSIEAVRENVAYAAFTDDDINGLLTEETIRAGSLGALERRVVRLHLGFLRLADQFFARTDVPLAAFYGWFRQDQPQVLDQLLDVPSRTLRAALEAAVRGNIIPDITAQIGEILERVGSLRFEEGRLANHRFVIQLLNEATGRSLSGYAVAVTDPRAEPEDQDLGTLFTDGRGACAIIFSLPGDAPASTTRRLQLRISDAGVDVAEATVEARTNQQEVAVVRVRVRESEHGDVSIDDTAPPALAQRLRVQGIRTLNDVLAHPEVIDEEDAEGLERLRATAKFAVLAPNLAPEAREHLINQGSRSLLDVAAMSRAEFVRDHHDDLGGDAATYATHFAARETRKTLYHMINSAWLKNVTSPDDEPPDPDIPTGVNDVLEGFKKCGCKDCSSAVSPTAYLAHLLQWTLEHIKGGTASISFSQLGEEFHQPFGDLPASCSAVEVQVPQVRICVEALWRFTDFLTRDDLQLPTPFRLAYRELRNRLYRLILNNLGTSFEQLRTATLNIAGESLAAQQVAAQRQALADILGIDASHLNELFFNIEQPPVSPSEAELEELFGFKSTRAENIFAAPPTPQLIAWQRERLEAIWQTQDWSIDAYSGEARLPFVDPALIDESCLRTPLPENPAFALLDARGQALAAHRQSLVEQNPQQNGLSALLESELGANIEQLRALHATLQANENSEAVAQAQDSIAALNLTAAGFSHLMTVDARLQAGEPLGLTAAEIDAAWQAVFDILSRAHRLTLFAAWVQEENDLGLVFGPKLFWLPLGPLAPVSAWLATPVERTQWQEALGKRSSPAIVDPAQITADYVIVVVAFDASAVFVGLEPPPAEPQPPLTAFATWEQRQAWIDGRLEALSAARQGEPTLVARLQAALNASTLGIGLEVFDELAALDTEGQDLGPRLAQLSLTKPEYRFLAEIHQLAQAGASASSDQLSAFDAIVVRAEKRRESAEWRLEEQEVEITLHPNRFVVPSNPPSPDDSPQTPWLHDPVALQQWVATLGARGEQRKALNEGLASAVDKAAEQVLPLLRNILIMQTVAEGDSLLEKAEWLDKRLLVDMRMDGCHLTTRVSQAIETLQRFIRGVYTQEHLDIMQHLTLDAEDDYEAEWPVLGSYATWRAFMLAYLYPENLLHLTPPARQSYGFTRLKQTLPSRVEPKDACAAAEAYSNYFQDVFHLDVQASCQVLTRVNREEGCGATTAALRSLVHMFAVATTSGKVYTNTFDSCFDSKDTLATWQPVLQLSDVIELIGAVPHETPSGQRLILLFAKVREGSKTALKHVQYDLDTNDGLWTKPKELDLPPGAEHDFTAVAVQKRHGSTGETLGLALSDGLSNESVPTILAIRAPNGRVYVRNLNAKASDWAGDDWIPLFGDLKAEQYKKVCALIQRSRDEYLVIVESHDGSLSYRIFSIEPVVSRDDGFWRSIANGTFGGAFVWPGVSDVFVFYGSGGKTKYAVIRESADFVPAGYPVQSINEINAWLKTVPGVDLQDFALDFSEPIVLVDWPEQINESNVIPKDKDIEVPYVGNLFALLSLTEATWEWELPKLSLIEAGTFGAEPSGIPGLRRLILLVVQRAGLAKFGEALKRAVKEGFHHPEFGQWKLADWYVRQFADGKGLTTTVEDAFDTLPTIFRFRGFTTEAEFVDTASTDEWHFVPSGGDEEFGPNPRKAMALRVTNGAFRLKLQRSGSVLSTAKLYRATPIGNGPFDIAPLVGKEDLQLRREEIREMYQGLGSEASIQMYLREAYNLVPTYLAYGLQRNGRYEEALLWYRLVYDYLQTANKAKIDHGLKLEASLALDFELADEWLNDASNPHDIAATRKNTYTRHILLMIIRCLIEHADALFSHDNVTDNSRARELYTQALKLLELDELKLGTSSCANILGQLEIEVTEPVTLPLQQFQVVLAEFAGPDHLRSVVTTLTAMSQDTTRPTIERLTEMREVLVSAVNDIPAAPRMTDVLDTNRQTVATLENRFLAGEPGLELLAKTHQRRHQLTLTNLTEVTDLSEEALLEVSTQLPWLRQARTEERVDAPDESLDLTLFNASRSGRLTVLNQIKSTLPMASLSVTQSKSFVPATGLSFDFCIPQNPVIQTLKTRVENNLSKLRTCRNIAGFLRQLDPYGAPIGIGSGIVSPDGTVFSGIVEAPPTAYRYSALIARAKELVGISQQIEGEYRTALENAEREALTLLQAEQNVELANARVTLQDLRINQANTELGLAKLQKNSAVLREDTFAGWIAAGLSNYEDETLQAYQDAGEAQQAAAKANAVGEAANAAMAGLTMGGSPVEWVFAGVRSALAHVVGASAIAEGIFNVQAIRAQTNAQVNSALASFERRAQEWRLQQGLAALDVQIGDQQILLAQNQIGIVQQERAIAGLEQTHAVDVLNFLLGKSFTEEMYRWIAGVLEDVYRYFLQEATVVARLAGRQLAFERQQAPLKVIQADYWNVAAEATTATASNSDRLGLTGSARLLQDVYRLDNFAFDTRRRKQALTLTLDLAAMFPVEFQRFRETGLLVFETPLSLIDRQMPGYHLCLIQQVSVSVVALIPPTYGIRATLTSSGISRAVVGGDTFQTVTIRNLPERMALTAASTTSGPIALEPDSQTLLNPFEGTGFDTLWELHMAKAANPFDYNSMATVLFTVNLTALHSFDYEREVIQRMDRAVTFDRAFDFRQVFADPWYDLNNPDQTATPMAVRFQTHRGDFPPNLGNLSIEHVVLYLVRKDGEQFEQEIQSLRFTPEGTNGATGGALRTIAGKVSTRSGNGTNLLPLIGTSPVGQWELAFPNNAETRSRFTDETIENILLVLTCKGLTAAWPT